MQKDVEYLIYRGGIASNKVKDEWPNLKAGKKGNLVWNNMLN